MHRARFNTVLKVAVDRQTQIRHCMGTKHTGLDGTQLEKTLLSDKEFIHVKNPASQSTFGKFVAVNEEEMNELFTLK